MTKPDTLKALAFAALIALPGCQTYSLVPVERVSISDSFTIEPDTNWNKRTQEGSEVWTIDGEGLQAVHLYKGLKDGDTLFKLPNSEQQKNMPAFSDTMSLLELREFIEASLAQTGVTNLKSGTFEPKKFGGKDGFRFDITYFDKNGLLKTGFAEGAKSNGKLYLVLYVGTKLYYYDKHLRNVENMIRSAQLSMAPPSRADFSSN